ncbi:MAG: hypothetical protein JJU37_09360 [Balneolaceae bacterium]|nr:hypothetical protein [Balneolaceae bacterium]
MKELSYWQIGIQYLHLAQHVSGMIVESGNKLVVFSDEEITEEFYEEETRWADHNLAIPLFFNFYHGLEVILKGFLLAKRVKVNHSHKLSALLKLFEENYGNNELSNIISNYVDQDKLKEPLHSFFKKSSVTTNQFYQALKYPESKKGNIYLFEELTEKGTEGVSFFKQLVKDTSKIRRETVKLGYLMIEVGN